MSSPARTLGIIGGSGLYALEALTEVEALSIATPFGTPSDSIVAGRLGDTRLLFLPRHGQGHTIPPHRINYRANVLALKMAGAEQILSVSAVGSMQEHIHPGDMVVVDQFIDRTRHRTDTFFDDDGVVAHVGFAHPVDAELAAAVCGAARQAGATVHEGGTYLCMEGPQFSTLAEVNALPILGRFGHRNDELSRGAVGARSRAPLRNACDGHGLRLLARGPRRGHGRSRYRRHAEERRSRQADHRRAGVERTGPGRKPRGSPRSTARSSPNPDTISADVREKLRPLIGKYIP